MPSDDLLARPATELARRIAARELTAVELLEAHLDRIAEVNARLNAVIQLDERAHQQAAAADAAVAADQPLGPLHGVPFTVKDWIETEGLVCAAGHEERATFVPRADATAVARMRAAGAVLIGKTNVVEGGAGHPRPNNPHDVDRTPGSSSSGEAAIIAAGGSPLGLGSDSGGSIRWPAHCTGIVGLKPSTGLVPNTGHFPPLGHMSDPRTAIGPLARSARDLEVALRVIAGPDPADPGSLPIAIGDPAAVDLRGLRVATFTDLPGATPTDDTVAAVAEAARALTDAGCEVIEESPPRLDEAMPITRAYWARVQSMSFKRWVPPRASSLTADEIEESRFNWERFTRDMYAFMRDVDAILCPAAARPAPPHDQWNFEEYRYTVPFSLTRQPAAVVPWTRSTEGLPIGVQLVARTWCDDVVIALALALEERSEPREPLVPPPLAR